jgi:hypothetical protein
LPRRTLAEELYSEAEETPEEEDVEWLLLYDFRDMKPHTNFWTNLSRLTALGGRSRLIQYSAFVTCSRRIVVSAKELAEHYGASTEVFRGREAEL